METTLVYDGTFDGFLTCVFMAYDMKLKAVSIVKEKHFQEPMFGSWDLVNTEPEKATGFGRA